MRKSSIFSVVLLFALSSFYSTTAHAERGKLISYRLITSYSTEALDSIWKAKNIKKFAAPINYPLDVFEVIYETAWHDGSAIEASGIFFLPKKADKAFPMICYHHGTQMVKDRAIGFGGEQAICTVFSTSGYMVAFPDYIGLGAGKKTHLYHHVETEASASIDLLRAVKVLLEKENAKQNEFLFLTGYSQGGHATLATLKVMQEKHAGEFKVTAAAPMSGAYDLAGIQTQYMFQPYKHPAYLPYLLYSYDEVYNCFDDPNSCFKTAYAEVLPPLFDGKHSMNDIDKFMPSIPKDVLKDEFVEAFKNNNDFPFKVALSQNSVHDFKPEVPVMMCYCTADEQVNYKNAFIAKDAMEAKGAKHIKLQNAGKKFGHGQCAIYASAYTKMYFDSFLKGSKHGRKGPLVKRMALATLKVKR
ncbi:MAG: lipase family protein [Bacteroidia bacterium]